jgi:dolichol-phosphate mannosyltransferase
MTSLLSIVVPCFNEEASLGALYQRLSSLVGAVYQNSEIILIDDGSTDQTWSILIGLAAQDKRIVAVRLSRNHGHQLALSAGLSLAQGDRVFILDADLQDPPELLPQMMTIMDQGAEVVYGVRQSREGENWFKTQSASLFYRLLESLTDVPIPRDTGDFRLISRRALDILNAMPENHRFIRGLVSWIGLRQEPIAYHRAPRQYGHTHYPLRAMIRLAFDAITGFSVKPLRLASYLGVLFAFMGLMSIGYTLYSWAALGALPGWTSVMSAVLVLGSVQLLILGIFGEYLGRLYIETKKRPIFIVDCIIRADQ